MEDIYVAYVKTESGDEYMVGYWIDKPTDLQISMQVVESIPYEMEDHLAFKDKDLEWAKQNPEEACNMSLLYPEVYKVKSAH